MRFVGLRLASRCFALAALVAAGPLAGCQNTHLGQPCDLGTTPAGVPGGAQIVTISSPALECPSRICVGGAPPAGTGGLCTAGCESDQDCQDAETAPANGPSGGRCEMGFACMWPTTVGDFACQKLCVCRDLVGEPIGGFQKPATCP